MATAAPRGAPSASLAERLGPLVVGSRRDLTVCRQIVRGAPRYVVHDPVAFRNHALTPLEYRILCSFGFHKTLADVFRGLVADRVLADADADEFFEFVLSLHGMGLLVVPGVPAEVVQRRHEERRRAARQGWLRYLLSLRVPLGNPDRVLGGLLPCVRWLFGPFGLALWALLLAIATWQCGGRLGELYGGATDLLALQKLPIVWCALVVMKTLHELGHAFATKRLGGAVPEFGVLFVFMTPCAYVDANASWTFPSRWRRIAVALAGMYVETLVAFVFALVWAGTQPGLLHDVAQSVVVLASITTVLINSNPLIKFDGYYAFSDLIGVFNLQERAMRYLRGTAERVLLGLPQPQDDHTRTERLLVWLYAPASFVYRVSLALGVTALMLTTWPAVGAALGVAFGWMMIGSPLVRLFTYLWRGERTQAARLRARFVAVAGIVAAVLVCALVPISHSVVAPGVLDPRTKRSVRAPAACFVQSIDVADGDVVEAGTSLCRLRDPELEEQRLELEGELQAARIQFDAIELTDAPLAATLQARIDFLAKRLGELNARIGALAMVVPERATVVGPRSVVPGQFVQQGDELLQVHSEHRFVRVVLTDHEVTRARLEVGSEAELRWFTDAGPKVRAVVREIRSSASRWHVPVPLTLVGGGGIYARGTSQGLAADQPYLHVFLEVDSVPLQVAGSGLRAQVRFAAGVETVGGWMRRRLLTFLYNWRTT